MGLVRGKTDKMDAERIGLHAFRNQDKTKAYSAKDEFIERVSKILAARERLIRAKNMLSVPMQELKEVGLKEEKRGWSKKHVRRVYLLWRRRSRKLIRI